MPIAPAGSTLVKTYPKITPSFFSDRFFRDLSQILLALDAPTKVVSISSRPRLYPSDRDIGDVLEPSDTATPLITACVKNDVKRLRAMLRESEWATIALAGPQRIHNEIDFADFGAGGESKGLSKPMFNFAFMVEEVARHDYAPVVGTLLAFAHEQGVPYEKLVQCSSLQAALRNGRKPVFEQFAGVEWEGRVNIRRSFVKFLCLFQQ